MKFFNNVVCPNTTLIVFFIYFTKPYAVYLLPHTKLLAYSVRTGLWGVLPGAD